MQREGRGQQVTQVEYSGDCRGGSACRGSEGGTAAWGEKKETIHAGGRNGAPWMGGGGRARLKFKEAVPRRNASTPETRVPGGAAGRDP